MKSYNTNNTFKDENVALENSFKIKYSASKMTLVATLAVWSSHCWTRDYVSYGNKLLPLKTSSTFLIFFPKKLLKLSMTTCKQNSESSSLCCNHKSLWEIYDL